MEPEADFIKQASIENIPFEDNTFDLIVSTDLIEHLPDSVLDNGLSEMNRVLVNGGNAIVTTLLEEKLENNACKCPECGEIFHRIYHVQSFTKDELIKRFENAGFSIEKIIVTHLGMYSMHPIILSLTKMFYKIFPLEIRKLFKKDILIVASKK